MSDLQEIKETVNNIQVILTNFRIEMSERVSKLEVKAGIWGFLGGLGAVAIALGIWAVKSSI